MKISYDVSVDDLVQFNLYILRKGEKNWMIFLTTLITLIFLYNFVAVGLGAALVSILILLPALLSVSYAIANPLRTLLLLAGYITALLAIIYMSGTALMQVAVLLPTFFALSIFVGGAFTKTYIKSFYKGKNDMTGVRSLEISEQGLFETTSTSSSTYKWDAVTSVEQDERNIYIFLGKLKAFVVPIAELSESGTKQKVLDELGRLRSSTS